MSTYICPYCFHQTDTGILRFQCANTSCNMQDRIRAEFLKDGPLAPGEVPKLSRTVFPVPAPGWISRFFGAKVPREAYCPTCQQRTSTQACPHCHSPFPHGVDELSNMVIAVIGSKETGKSNYIAVLIQRIYELYEQFHWTLLAMDDATMKLYNRVFYAPLYQKGQAVETTQTGHANQDVRRPLLYSLSMTRGRELKTITLAFFDTAGEDLSDREASDFDVIESMAKINRYIYNAAGIILLVDPLRIPEIRTKVELSGVPSEEMSTETNTAAGNIIFRTSQLIYRGKDISRSKKIDIPLAVVFSKIDLLKKNILGADAAVYQQSRHKGFFSLADFQNNHDCIRDWIGEYDKQFMQTIPMFREAAFFGVSALGGNPDVNKKLPFPTPHPIRVEDPFLWLLWQKGFIKGK
ncbi:MAG: hypothetical protein FWC50_09080 [Planctomycetaceae bacterium]|nr:hypothetical protein [Planctomycetaceae bacterium]